MKQYISILPYDKRIFGDNGIISDPLVQYNEFAAQILTNLRKFEMNTWGFGSVGEPSAIISLDYKIWFERHFGGSLPFGTVRYELYLDIDGAELKGKPTSNFYVYTFIMNMQDLDKAFQFETYIPEDQTKHLFMLNRKVEKIAMLAELMRFGANEYKFADMRDIDGVDRMTDSKNALVKMLYLSKGNQNTKVFLNDQNTEWGIINQTQEAGSFRFNISFYVGGDTYSYRVNAVTLSYYHTIYSRGESLSKYFELVDLMKI